jgi:hypothetical protein
MKIKYWKICQLSIVKEKNKSFNTF